MCKRNSIFFTLCKTVLSVFWRKKDLSLVGVNVRKSHNHYTTRNCKEKRKRITREQHQKAASAYCTMIGREEGWFYFTLH